MANFLFFGANSDIAKVTAKLLGEQHQLFLGTRDPSKLPESFQQTYACFACDAADFDQVEQLIESISAQTKLDGVVNFCGSIMLKSAAMLTLQDWQSTIKINLTSAFNVAHAVAKFIKQDAVLVLISTSAAHVGLPNHEAIAAAKAGVEGLARSFAASYAKQNLRCNVVAPGLIETNLTQPILKTERGKALSLSLHALNRFGKPSDIARAVAWLLDPENAWITGEVIRVDGGLTTTKCYPG